MRVRIDCFDWAAGPLGVPKGWPLSLQGTIDTILDCPMPMALLWGQDLIHIYNDAFATILGRRHPGALGRPAREGWPEAWAVNASFCAAGLRGESRCFKNRELPVPRNDAAGTAFFNMTFSPVRLKNGEVGGVLVTASETTLDIMARRRQQFRAELEKRLRPLREAREVLAAACEELGKYLRAGQSAYAEIDEASMVAIIERDWNDGTIPSNRGQHDMTPFGSALIAGLKAGRTFAISDVRADPNISTPEALAAFMRISVSSVLIVPLVKAGRLVATFGVACREPRVWLRDDVALAEEVAELTWAAVERARADTILREREELFRSFADASSDVVWIADADSRRLRYLSPAFETVWGETRERMFTDTLRFAALLHTDDRMQVLERFPRILEGRRYTAEYRIIRPSDGATRWIRDTGFPIRDAAGAVRRVAGIAQDITAHKEAIQRQQVLVAELQHRTRNLLAVVSSIAKQTKAVHGSLEDFTEVFSGRLMALSRVQGLLTRSDEELATIDTLVRMQLDAFGARSFSGRIMIDGPKASLPSSAVQTLALALHELASNAVKHGALSGESGSLSVQWYLQDGDKFLKLRWVERGVTIAPEAVGEGRRGFGRELLEWALPYTLNARTKFELKETGLTFEIELPLDEAAEDMSLF